MRIKRSELFQIFTVLTMSVLGAFIVVPKGEVETYIYYILTLLIALSLISSSVKMSNQRVATVFFCLGLFVMTTIMAYRNMSGIDDSTYRMIFKQAENYNFFEYLGYGQVEPAFMAINYVIYYLSNGDYFVSQAVFAFIPIFMFGFSFWKIRERINVPIAILLVFTHFYFLVLNAAIIRIFVAVSIVAFGMTYLADRRTKEYIITIIIASLFHRSSLIMLLMLFFAQKREFWLKRWRTFLVIAIVGVPIAFYLIARIIVPMLGGKYMGYGILNAFSFSLKDLDMLPIFIIGCLLYLRHTKGEGNQRNLYIICLVLIGLSCIFAISSRVVSIGRVIYYTNIGIVFWSGMVCKSRPNFRSKDYFFQNVVIVYAFLYMFYTAFYMNSQNLFPYNGIWISF